MRSPYRSPNLSSRSRPPGPRLLGGFVKFCLIVALILVAAWFYFETTVRSKLAGKIEQRLNEVVASSGLHVSVGQAQFVDGKGVALNNLAVSSLLPNLRNAQAGSSQNRPPLIEFYDAFVHLPVSMTDMVLGKHAPERLDIRRARLNLVRERDGQWELAKFISAFKPKPGAKPIPVSIKDSEIRIVDNTRQPPLVQRFTDVQVDFQNLIREGRKLTQVTFQCAGSEVGGFYASVLADIQSGDFDVHFNTRGLRMSPALFALLPDTLSDRVAPIKSLTGTLETEGRVSGNLNDTVPRFIATGSIEDFSIDDARLPVPLTRASASFLLSENEIRVTNAGGRIGNGSFRVDYQQDGFLDRKTWKLSGVAKHLEFHHVIALSHLAPKGCNQFCHDFSPQGTCDMDFRVGHNGQSKYRQLNACLLYTSPSPRDRG